MEPEKTTRTSFKEKLKHMVQAVKQHWNALSKKQRVAVIAVALVLIFLCLVAAWKIGTRKTNGSINLLTGDTKSDALDVLSPEPPLTKELPLDGAKVTEEDYTSIMKYLPMAVMIENLYTIRPVSGLSRADLVYEALVEGGITRYMAVFLHHDADEIMPVRSSRSYYIDWLEALDATYMHIGGAISDNPRAVALPRIFSEGIKTYMNAQGAWWRKSGVVAPHNAFTSTQRMKDIQDRLGWARATTLEPWKYKDDQSTTSDTTEESSETSTEKTISLEWNGLGKNGYEVRWVYDPSNNNYIYEVGGVRQTDAATSETVTAKNVVMQYTGFSYANDGYGHVLYDTVGEGEALIFMDGDVTLGTWKKPSLSTRERYYDSEGNEITFNRGRTWIEVIPTGSLVEY